MQQSQLISFPLRKLQQFQYKSSLFQMLSQVSVLLFIYYKDQQSQIDQERFLYYCGTIVLLNFLGFIMKQIEQHPKSKNSNLKPITEIICSLIGLIAIIYYFWIYFFEFSLRSTSIFIGLFFIWIIECSFYYVLSDKGIQSMLSLFITTNTLLINGEIALRGAGNFSNIFEYSSINLIVLCTQFSWAGEPQTKQTNSLFYIISRQDCFRLMVYFLIFNIINNSIKAFVDDTNAIFPTLAVLVPYIWATSKFSQRRYKQAFFLFFISLLIYFPIEVYLKQLQNHGQIVEQQ